MRERHKVGNHSFASPSSHFRKTTANKDGCRTFEKISYCFTLLLLHLLFGFLVRSLSHRFSITVSLCLCAFTLPRCEVSVLFSFSHLISSVISYFSLNRRYSLRPQREGVINKVFRFIFFFIFGKMKRG